MAFKKVGQGIKIEDEKALEELKSLGEASEEEISDLAEEVSTKLPEIALFEYRKTKTEDNFSSGGGTFRRG